MNDLLTGAGQEWRRRFAEADGRYRYRHVSWRGRETWTRHLPLPLRTRARLRAARAVDSAAIWLIGRDRIEDARRLWRVTGMWR